MKSIVSAFFVFGPEVASNTHDFEVRTVTHDGREMLGVVARQDLKRCPLFLGVYPGLQMSKADSERKLAAYADRYGVDRAAAELALRYNVAAERYGADVELDPTDDDGHLLPEFAGHIALYVNEVPPRATPTASFIYNEPRERYEIWLLEPLRAGEEVFTCYGNNYRRDYPFNITVCHNREWSHIGNGSTFISDRRGDPPVWTPE
ncbi:MAG: hypothetical protein JXA21_16635 [Anaerolineae bacterium]|nr:hypothetical protein [Anaerolineae bacterium]